MKMMHIIFKLIARRIVSIQLLFFYIDVIKMFKPKISIYGCKLGFIVYVFRLQFV